MGPHSALGQSRINRAVGPGRDWWSEHCTTRMFHYRPYRDPESYMKKECLRGKKVNQIVETIKSKKALNFAKEKAKEKAIVRALGPSGLNAENWAQSGWVIDNSKREVKFTSKFINYIENTKLKKN